MEAPGKPANKKIDLPKDKNFIFLSILVICILFSTTTTFGSENPGDINNDGAVDLSDGVLPLPILSGQSADGLNIDISADVNGDGRIGFQEAAFALQWAAELRESQQNSDARLSGMMPKKNAAVEKMGLTRPLIPVYSGKGHLQRKKEREKIARFPRQ